MKSQSNSKKTRVSRSRGQGAKRVEKRLRAGRKAAVARPAEADRADRKGNERAQHVDAFQKRRKRPGPAGLANEARPGLGTRADEGVTKREEGTALKKPGKPRAPAAARNYREPAPAPREQRPDTMAHELERSTGMSGQSSGT